MFDNNSSDGSRDFFQGRFPTVTFTWNSQNLGFAKANNIVLTYASGDYILFLNPDTLVPEDCFHKCVTFLNSKEDSGALGVRMVDGAGKFLKESKRSYPSPLTSLYKLSGLARLFPHSKTFGSYHLGNLNPLQNHEVDVLAGAFMMIPKKIINIVGPFDEDFFMYGEDVDLSFRIQQAGYKNYYFAGTGILHFKGESTRKGSLNYVKLFYKAMIIFVRKHYGGSKAGLFTFLIQSAILIRACISVIGKFINWVGMPVIDAAIILMSFWGTKIWWNLLVKKDVNYSYDLLLIAFPVFTIVFLLTAYYTGLYDNGYKQSRLNRSTLIALLILLAGYALLPESIRFSRGILLFGILVAFIMISLLRLLLIKWQVIQSANGEQEHRQTIIVGSGEEFARAHKLMDKAGMKERVLGRVEVNGNQNNTIGNLKNLGALLKMYPIREVVFCEGKLTFKTILESLPGIPSHIRVKFHAGNSESIIGSDRKDMIGKIISNDKTMKLAMAINKRNKRLVGILLAIGFLLSFPVHMILQKHRLRFFKNVGYVLFLQKEWIGYAGSGHLLPIIKPGILTTTGLPGKINILPIQSLESTDLWYASDYNVMQDIGLVLNGYPYLCEL